MAVTVKGILVDPVGQAMPGTTIRIRALDNESTLAGLSSSVVTGPLGEYWFVLDTGNYSIELLHVKYWLSGIVYIGDIGITPPDDEVTLEELFENYAVYEPELPVCTPEDGDGEDGDDDETSSSGGYWISPCELRVNEEGDKVCDGGCSLE